MQQHQIYAALAFAYSCIAAHAAELHIHVQLSLPGKAQCKDTVAWHAHCLLAVCTQAQAPRLKKTGKQEDRQTFASKQTGPELPVQIHRHTDTHTDTHTHRQRQTHREDRD